MQTFTLTVLAIYSRNPSASRSRINHIVGVPPAMIRHERQFLGEIGYLEKDENLHWHITDKGLKALQEFDREKAKENAAFLKDATLTAATALNVSPNELSRFSLLDKGMTNDSYTFLCAGQKYIYRRAGSGSDMLVDRNKEYATYQALFGKGISDVVVYHNPFSGTKITEFLQDSKSIDKHNPRHIKLALDALRKLHRRNIIPPHEFDFEKTITYYEEICYKADAQLFDTYPKYKAVIMNLLEKVKNMNTEKCFCHIDFVPGNCLITKDGPVVLIDWEYAGRQDPIVDVAMFCISASYNKRQSDKLLELYLERKPTVAEKARFYTYIATRGLMWSLWSVFKTANGEIFEGYTERTYNLAKKYSKIAGETFGKL